MCNKDGAKKVFWWQTNNGWQQAAKLWEPIAAGLSTPEIAKRPGIGKKRRVSDGR